MSSERQQLSVNLKVRVTPDDDSALERLAGKKRQTKAQIARTAIAEFLDRQPYPLKMSGIMGDHGLNAAAITADGEEAR